MGALIFAAIMIGGFMLLAKGVEALHDYLWPPKPSRWEAYLDSLDDDERDD